MKVLVTGSSGQLGRVTVEHLKANGHQVTGIDLVPASTTDEVLDVQNKNEVALVTKGYDAIIHTAAMHGKHYELHYPREAFINTNILGTLNLLNACLKNGVRKFLYTSTTSIYGESMVDDEKAVWVDEQLIERPRDIYDITKKTAEQLCRDFFYKEGLQTSVYRVGRFLPEGDNLKFNHRLYRGLDERDGAEAFRLALGLEFEAFEIFNISAGSLFTPQDLMSLKKDPAAVIRKYYPLAEAYYADKGWTLPSSVDRVYVCDKAKQYLNYWPRYTFDYLLNS